MQKPTLSLLLMLLAAPLAAQEMESAPTSTGKVARAQFTTNVVAREPVDTIAQLDSEKRKVYFFSDLRDFEGETITHRWEYNGVVMAVVSFDVGGDRWRVYSSKNMEPMWLGQWTVTVMDSEGEALETMNFEYTRAESTALLGSMAAE